MAISDKVIADNEETLTKQSRSFAIPILALDERFRHPIMVEYNLNKTIDTIEDSDVLEPDEKASFTEAFCQSLEREVVPDEVRRRMLEVTPAGEKFVFQNWEATMELFRSLSDGEKSLARQWTSEMARGMGGYLERPIETPADLDDYCYYVAGTVGMYLTGLLRLNGRGVTPEVYERLKADAVHFGLFLQKLNVIRDIAEDEQSKGRSFWPRAYLESGRDEIAVLNTMCYEALHNNLPRAIAYATGIPEGNDSYDFFLRFILTSGIEYLRILKNNPSVFSRLKVKLPGVFVRQLYQRVSALSRAEFAEYCERMLAEEIAYYERLDKIDLHESEAVPPRAERLGG